MNYRKKILILFGGMICISILAISSAYFSNKLICNSYSCHDFLFGERYILFIFTPLFISASLLFQLIFSERVFNVWKKFAMVAIPLMIIGILLVKVDPIACGNLICVDRTFMIFLTGILYLVLSFLTTIISAIYFNSKIK
jgi:hypothetical protein